MFDRLEWRRRVPILLYILVLTLYPVTALVNYAAQLHAPMPELYVLANDPAVIHKVYPGSGAEAAGVRAGDIILQMNGLPFDHHYLSLQMSQLKVGELLALDLERSGQRISVNIPLVSVRDIIAERYLLFSTVAFIFWISSALLAWHRLQHVEMRLLFLICQATSLGLLSPYVDVLHWFNTTTRAIGLSTGIVSALLLFHFNITFPIAFGTPRLRRNMLMIVYTLGLTLTAVWLLLNLTRSEAHGFGPVLAVYIAIVIIAAVTIQVYSYKNHASSDARRRLRLIILGELVAGGLPALLYLGPAAILGYALIPEWVVVLCLSVAPLAFSVAIFRHNLLDIDRILNHSVVNTVFLLTILIFLLAPISIVYWLIGSWPGSIFIVAGLLILAFLMFDRVRSVIRRMVDRLFYGGWYDFTKVVEQTSDALASSLEWQQLVDILTRRVPHLMQLHGGYLQIEDQATTKLDSSLQPQLEFPLIFDGKIVGLWVVGPRRDGEVFSSDDQRIFHTLGHQAQIAVINMLLVKGMRDQLVEIRANREQLSHFDRQLMTTREEERASLARDLHDGPVQSLIALNFQLGMISPDSDASSVQSIREEIKEVVLDLRTLCAELRPPMLDTMGFGAALRDLAQDWLSQYGTPINIDQPPDAVLRRLPEEIAVNLYRVAQEALSNIARHAEAQHVTICLKWDELSSILEMTIADDGKGFVYDPAGLIAAEGHLGLVNMRERVGLIGGEWRLDTAPGQGTRVSITWHVTQLPG